MTETNSTSSNITDLFWEKVFDKKTQTWGMGYSRDNGLTYKLLLNLYGRIYSDDDAKKLYKLLKPYFGNSTSNGSGGPVTSSIAWADILNKPDLVTTDYLNQRLSSISQSGQITSLDWSQITNKPDLATKEDLNNVKTKSGKSAYEIAVEHGFVGSEDDWLKSLHGKDGTSSGGSEGDTSLSTEAITDLIKQHIKARLDVKSGNLVVEVNDVSNGSMVDAIATKVAHSLHFKMVNGNLMTSVGGE